MRMFCRLNYSTTTIVDCRGYVMCIILKIYTLCRLGWTTIACMYTVYMYLYTTAALCAARTWSFKTYVLSTLISIGSEYIQLKILNTISKSRIYSTYVCSVIILVIVVSTDTWSTSINVFFFFFLWSIHRRKVLPSKYVQYTLIWVYCSRVIP